ncbi:MAG: ABC transporter permease [Bacteroidales bacterium]|jgi:putative ABC transport system permease protein|nr:ABC transporter permease [Bacteroidales bacterium]
MFKNYFIIAIRNLVRQKGYFFINLFGLTIGLTACLLITFYVINELSYDKFHEKGDRIYRVGYQYKVPSGDIHKMPMTEYRFKEAFEAYFNQIEEFVRISMPGSFYIEYDHKKFYETGVSLVDENFLDVFTYDWISGNKETALNKPFAAVITESVAKKYFGDSNPLGKSMRVYHETGEAEITITGVIKDMPQNAHFHLSILVSMKTGKYVYNNMVLNNWGETSQFCYILLPEKGSIKSLEKLSKDYIKTTFGSNGAWSGADLLFQPLYDIHLKSNTRYEFETNGNIRNVIIFSIIALFILLIATINYMNLATARSAKRAMEVGIRKILGAGRKNLIFQFIGEAIIISFIAVWLSVAFADLFLPKFNQLAGKEINIDWMNNLWIILFTIIVAVIIGIIAGSYPAFVLSSFKPLKVLKEKIKFSSSSSFLRKILVVFQFSISVTLIICTLIVFIQWRYMQNKPLGIDPSNIIMIRNPGVKQYETFKQELLKNPDIISVTGSNKRPTHKLSSNLSYKAENVDSEDKSIKLVTVDYDFFETLNNEIIQGRSFSRAISSDEYASFIINETAMKEFGWDNAIGKSFETMTMDSSGNHWIPRKGQIVGVARDFHFESVHNKIPPMVFFIDHNWRDWVSIKINSANTNQTLGYIKQVWSRMNTERYFDPGFYDESIDALYRAEKRFFILFIIFSILAISIACLGIFGLASFTAEQRTKEIGIRKTMGASVTSIIQLINKEFIKLVILSNLIAWPIAWYFMGNWLNNYTYRIELTLRPFILSGLIAIGIALLSVSYQALKASKTNPVNALRYE